MAKAELHHLIDDIGANGGSTSIHQENGDWVLSVEQDDVSVEVRHSSFTTALAMLNAAWEAVG